MFTVFFDIKGVVHHEILHQGQRVNHWYYLEVLKRLRQNIRRKRSQLWRNNSRCLDDNSASAHASLLNHDYLTNTNTTVLPQPPYSSDLTLADFLISQAEILFERMTILDNSKAYRKFAAGATYNPKKGVPGLFPEFVMALGAMHQCRRGVL
jgi:hypothetical protein